MATQQLFKLTSEDHKIPHAIDYRNGELITVEGDNIPVMSWPDGTVCWEANLYMLDLYKKGQSRENKGGSLSTNAKQISHLIRYCFNNKVNFCDLTENHFKLFIGTLKGERKSDDPATKKREVPHVGKIGRACLRFLLSIDDRLTGLELMRQIGAEEKIKQYKYNGKTYLKTYWHHDSIPSEQKSRERMPISDTAVDLLYEANADIDAPPFIYRRRYVMLRLLELTGGRRSELAKIKVEDIDAALDSGEIKLQSAKKKNKDAVRYVPFDRIEGADVKDYIAFYRRQVVQATIGVENDHGFLFVNEKNGKKLSSNTLGNEVWLLANKAGIEDEEACSHAFRHRFITKRIKQLIELEELNTPDDLKNLLAVKVDLKAKVMEWIGHECEETTNRYIHLAFEQVTGLSTTLNAMSACQSLESAQRSLADFRMQLNKPGADTALIASKVDQLLSTAIHALGKF